MFLSIPLVAWLFGLSLQNEQGYQAVLEHLKSLPLRLVSVVLVWSLSHHLLAGFRHLLLDIGIGSDKEPARATAWVVNIGALAFTGLYLVSLL
jgi:succinate dehydrogenase / fumarate reductase cytochrome b subunit